MPRSVLPETRSTRIKLAAAGLGVAALVLAGCGDNNDDDGHDMDSMSHSSMSNAPMSNAPSSAGSTATTAQFNQADVMFAQMMYPHHAQAVEMAGLVEGRSTDPQLIELATAIENEQGPEMTQLKQWLAQWGQPAPSDDMNGMDHGGGGMTGMMTDQEMSDLAAKTGPDFEQTWLAMMIEHHIGAIEMADTVIADGLSPQVEQMATAMVATQQSEIDTMRAMQT